MPLQSSPTISPSRQGYKASKSGRCTGCSRNETSSGIVVHSFFPVGRCQGLHKNDVEAGFLAEVLELLQHTTFGKTN